MQHVSIDDVEPLAMGDADRRGLTEPLGTSDLAINHYELEPGERFSGGMHTHLDQEELFVILSGTATFETMDETHEVSEGEVVRFDPGEYQTGFNDGDETVRAFALGAPRDSEEIRVPQECPECGHESMAFAQTEEGPMLECPDCGTQVDVPE